MTQSNSSDPKNNSDLNSETDLKLKDFFSKHAVTPPPPPANEFQNILNRIHTSKSEGFFSWFNLRRAIPASAVAIATFAVVMFTLLNEQKNEIHISNTSIEISQFEVPEDTLDLPLEGLPTLEIGNDFLELAQL